MPEEVSRRNGTLTELEAFQHPRPSSPLMPCVESKPHMYTAPHEWGGAYLVVALELVNDPAEEATLLLGLYRSGIARGE